MMGNDFGLVFAGGGGKGAWQIGVWKALEEAGIRGRAVSGTSVGGLNAALYAQGDYQMAETAWLSISNKELLAPNLKEILQKLLLHVATPAKVKKLLALISPLANIGKTIGVFSQDGLEKFVCDFLSIQHRSKFLPAYVACHCKTDEKIEYFNLFPGNGYSDETVKNILLASAAIPYVFDNIKINGKLYSDGGFDMIYSLTDGMLQAEQYNNCPVEPLAEHASELGISNIIILALNRDELTQRPHYGNLRVIPLLPSRSLGGLTDGCLDFNPEHAKMRIAQGYRDAKKWLDLVKGYMDDEERIEKIWDRVLAGEEDYLGANQTITLGFTDSADIEKDIADFNEIIMSDDGTKQLEAKRNVLSLEERLKKGDLALIDSQRRAELDHFVDILVDENKQNSDLLTGYAMDAVAALAPVESRATELLEQGFFGRLWHGITGKNSKMVSSSLFDLAQAQYASIQLIQKLQHENLLQFELTGALHARLNRLAYDVAQVQSNVNCQVREIYNSMALMYCKTRKKLLEHEDRIGRLEHNVRVLNWVNTVDVNTYCGRSFDALPTPAKMLAAAMDFYTLTNGAATADDLKLFRAVLKRTKLDKELISVCELAGTVNDMPELAQQYMEELRIGASDSQDRENWLPAVFENSELTVSGSELKQPVTLLADELFYLLRVNHWMPRKIEESGIKADYIQRCATLRKLVEEHPDELGTKILPEIANLEDRIRNYYFKINLIGPFSSGKSSLLNAWLKMDLLLNGISPETAVSTELMYSPEEKIILYPMDSNLPIETLPSVTDANLQRVKQRANAGQLLKVQIYLNHAKLQRYPEVCLVDMPGLSSGLRAHEEALNQFILDGGTGIFCVPMRDGTIQTDGLKFLERMGRFDCGFFLLMTKADEVNASEHPQILEICRNTIHEKLGIPQEDLMSGIVSARKEKIGIGDFTKLIDALLDQKDMIFKMKFEEELQDLCNECISQMRRIVSRSFTSGDLEHEMEKIRKTREKLPDIMKRISDGIERQIPTKTNNVVEKVKTTLYSLKSGLKAQLKAGQNCSGEIEANMKSTMVFELQNQANDLFQDAVRKAAKEFGEKLTYTVSAGDAPNAGLDDLPETHHERNGSIIGGAAGTAVGLIFGPLGGVIGGAIGGFLGKLFGKNKDDSELDSTLTYQLERCAEEVARPVIVKAFEAALDRFKKDLKTAMENKLNRLDENNRNLQKKLNENQAEFEKHKAAGEELMKQLQMIMPGKELPNEL